MTQSQPDVLPDLSACDREPIHIPGSIQPHGILLAVKEADYVIVQASANVAQLLRTPIDKILGKPLADLFGKRQVEVIRHAVAGESLEGNPLHAGSIVIPFEGLDERFDVSVHASDGLIILELEMTKSETLPTFQNLYPLVRNFVTEMQAVQAVGELCELAAKEVRRITGFDRVLIYQFDAEWNGTVVGEDRNDKLPSYLGLRFPSTDIPRQARDLYRLNRIRLIADAGYKPVPLVPAANPLTGKPLDLSFSILRSVSPVHVQYMKNMGTMSSFSVSVLSNGQLWGLISCHHATPRGVPADVRAACDFLAQVLSVQINARTSQTEFAERVRLQGVQARLLAYMAAEENFVDGLVKHPGELLEFASADGAALVFGGVIHLVGQTPSQSDVKQIVDWLAEKVQREVFSTDSLAAILPEAEQYKDQASGLLGIAISKLHRSYLLWFRPEVLRTVKWGGDPHKPAEPADTIGRLNPRRSFETWKETVRLSSVPWTAVQAQVATEFRNAVVGIVLRKAEEMAQVTNELEQSNKELEAFSYTVSHDLRAPFRHIVGFSQLLRESENDRLSEDGRRYLSTIIDSAQYAGKLVDNLLNFAQMGRAALTMVPVDMDALVQEVKQDVASEAGDRKIVWTIHPLARSRGDLTMLRLVWRNLIANAVKYSRNRPEPRIEIGSRSENGESVYFVRDNGVGFDMKYAGKLFGVFQRLHRMEEYEGTGIGLANVRRIIARHGGRTWAEAAPDAGATVYFSLPAPAASSEK